LARTGTPAIAAANLPATVTSTACGPTNDGAFILPSYGWPQPPRLQLRRAHAIPRHSAIEAGPFRSTNLQQNCTLMIGRSLCKRRQNGNSPRWNVSPRRANKQNASSSRTWCSAPVASRCPE
jgi:hypothetical protein